MSFACLLIHFFHLDPSSVFVLSTVLVPRQANLVYQREHLHIDQIVVDNRSPES